MQTKARSRRRIFLSRPPSKRARAGSARVSVVGWHIPPVRQCAGIRCDRRGCIIPKAHERIGLRQVPKRLRQSSEAIRLKSSSLMVRADLLKAGVPPRQRKVALGAALPAAAPTAYTMSTTQLEQQQYNRNPWVTTYQSAKGQ